MEKPKVIFFGNGPLADAALEVLREHFKIIFRVRERDDLEIVKELKKTNPDVHGILASFGVLIKPDVLDIFEPEGILNIHPSLLPLYRGASPIESAILNGDKNFSVSVMKLVKEMDAGPVYYQTTLKGLPLEKSEIYKTLAETGAKWICDNLANLPKPKKQDEKKATFCGKLEKNMSYLTPKKDSAETVYRKIIAYQGFPKPKYEFFNTHCIILEAHLMKTNEKALLTIPCKDGKSVVIDRLQPEGRKAMDARAFINGYGK